MSGGRQVYLIWDGGEVYLRGDHPEKRGLFVTDDGIEGWDSSPNTKVSMTEKQTSDGAHRLEDNNILYSSRTVTVHFRAHGDDRDDVLSLIKEVAEACHRMVKLRIVDAYNDTYCVGYTQHSIEAKWNNNWGIGTISIVCPDPKKLSWERKRIQLSPTSAGPGGLYYGDTGKGLNYPISYGTNPEEVKNVGTLVNNGTTTAYPIITVNGSINAGFMFDFGDRSLIYSQPVGDVPLVLDSSTRIASIGGLDVSRNLRSRGFIEVPPGGSVNVSFQATGTGWATIEWNDTYI